MPFWIVFVGWLTKGVLVFLIGLSVWSISIILKKRKQLREINDFSNFENIKKLISEGKLNSDSLESGIRGEFFKLLSKQPSKNIEHLLKSFVLEKKTELESDLSTLSTLGSNAPYIGLFGTVLGIIQSFGVLATNEQGGTAVIMASLSEALVATAVGLWVAIPAVAATNIFSKNLKSIFRDCENIKELHLAYSNK
jgi:biopolymer transport protein TolQ